MTDVLATSVGPPVPAAQPPVPAAAPAPVRAATTARTGPSKPSSGPVFIGAFTLFACFALLFASRMAAGEDPALGIRPGVLAQPAPPGVLQKLVVTRRISVNGLTRAQMRRRGVKRVIVVRQPAAAPATVTAVARGTTGTPSPTTVAATSAPAAPGRTQRSAGGGSPVVTDQPASPQATTPTTTAAPAPVATAPAAPEPTAAPTPAPAPAPAPVATTTS